MGKLKSPIGHGISGRLKSDDGHWTRLDQKEGFIPVVAVEKGHPPTLVAYVVEPADAELIAENPRMLDALRVIAGTCTDERCRKLAANAIGMSGKEGA